MHCKLSDFKILRQLGEGGFGCAYLAVNNRTEQEVCIKFIPLKGGTSSHRSALEEVQVLSELEDTHIIKYYGSFVEDEQLCIIMEYASGGSLYDVIQV